MKKIYLKILILMVFSAGLIVSCGGNTTTTESESTSNQEDQTSSPQTGAATYTLSGTITGGTSDADIAVTITAEGYSGDPATTDSDGKYSVAGLSSATYTVTPSKTGMVFTPTSASVELTADRSDVNFQAADVQNEEVPNSDIPNTNVPNTYTLSGTITGGTSNADITVTITADGYSTGPVTTGSDGKYSVTGLPSATYTVTPSKSGMVFRPVTSLSIELTADKSLDFQAADINSKSIPTSLESDMTILGCAGTDTRYPDSSAKVGKEANPDGLCWPQDNIYRTYLKFSLADIPANSTIQAASLSFYQSGGTGAYATNTLSIDHVDFGADLTSDDWNTTVLATTTNSASTANVTADIKDYVESDYTANLGYSEFQLKFPDDIGVGKYLTISVEAGNLPTLTITYYKF